MKNKIQYDAAVRYLEKNSYRINKTNMIFYLSLIGITSYFIILFFLKLTSCL